MNGCATCAEGGNGSSQRVSQSGNLPALEVTGRKGAQVFLTLPATNQLQRVFKFKARFFVCFVFKRDGVSLGLTSGFRWLVVKDET